MAQVDHRLVTCVCHPHCHHELLYLRDLCWSCDLVFTLGIMDATLPFHIEELVFRDQKLHISTNDTPQFLRLPFLADNVYSFTAFPNTMPGALPCLQTLSHWANFLLILFPSHSQLSVALGRCLLNWGRKKKAPSSLFSLPFLSVSRSLMSSPILVSTGKWESVWLPPLNQRLHCARTRQSRTTLIEVEQKKRGGGASERETCQEKQACCGARVSEIIHIVE